MVNQFLSSTETPPISPRCLVELSPPLPTHNELPNPLDPLSSPSSPGRDRSPAGEIEHNHIETWLKRSSQVDAHLPHTLSEKSAYNKEIRQICLLVKPLAKMTNYFLFLALWKAMDPMDTNTFVIHASHGFPQSISYFIWYAHYLALLLW